MSIEAPLGDMEEFIRARVDSGDYGSREEVLREAVALLQQRDTAWRNDVRSKVEAGLASYHAGRGVSGGAGWADFLAWRETQKAE